MMTLRGRSSCRRPLLATALAVVTVAASVAVTSAISTSPAAAATAVNTEPLLRNAVNTTGGVIDVAPGTYSLASELTVSKPGTVIRAVTPGTVTLLNTASNGRVLTVNTTGVKLEGLIFKGGVLSNADGGAILVANNKSVEISKSTVIANAAREGGGIANLGTLTLKQSTIVSNTSQKKGGGLLNNGTATVENSTFENNTADQGGAISSPGSITVTHSTIVRNKATSSSSAGILRTGGTFSVYYSVIGGNVRTNGTAAADCSGTPSLIGLNL